MLGSESVCMDGNLNMTVLRAYMVHGGSEYCDFVHCHRLSRIDSALTGQNTAGRALQLAAENDWEIPSECKIYWVHFLVLFGDRKRCVVQRFSVSEN